MRSKESQPNLLELIVFLNITKPRPYLAHALVIRLFTYTTAPYTLQGHAWRDLGVETVLLSMIKLNIFIMI